MIMPRENTSNSGKRQMTPKRILNLKSAAEFNIDRLTRDIDNFTQDMTNTGLTRGTAEILNDPAKGLSSDRYTPNTIKFQKHDKNTHANSYKGKSSSNEIDLEQAQFSILNNLENSTSFTSHNQWTSTYFDRLTLVLPGGDPNNTSDNILQSPYGYIESKDGYKYCKYKTLSTILELRAFGYPMPSIEEILLIHTSVISGLLNDYYKSRVDEIQLGGIAQLALSVIDGYNSDIQALSRLGVLCEARGDIPGALTSIALKAGMREKMTNQMKDIGLLPRKPEELIIHDSRKNATTDADKIRAIHSARNNQGLDLAAWMAEKEQERRASLTPEELVSERSKKRSGKSLIQPKHSQEEEILEIE